MFSPVCMNNRMLFTVLDEYTKSAETAPVRTGTGSSSLVIWSILYLAAWPIMPRWLFWAAWVSLHRATVLSIDKPFCFRRNPIQLNDTYVILKNPERCTASSEEKNIQIKAWLSHFASVETGAHPCLLKSIQNFYKQNNDPAGAQNLVSHFQLLPFSCRVEYCFQRLNLRHIKHRQAGDKFHKKHMQAEKSIPLKALPDEQGREKTRMKPKLPTTKWVNAPLQNPSSVTKGWKYLLTISFCSEMTETANWESLDFGWLLGTAP